MLKALPGLSMFLVEAGTFPSERFVHMSLNGSYTCQAVVPTVQLEQRRLRRRDDDLERMLALSPMLDINYPFRHGDSRTAILLIIAVADALLATGICLLLAGKLKEIDDIFGLSVEMNIFGLSVEMKRVGLLSFAEMGECV